MGVAKQPLDAGMLRERSATTDAHRGGSNFYSDVARRSLGLKHTQQGRVARLFKMIDQIIDASGEPVRVDLHLGDLRAQGRETFAQALAEMLEARSVEVLCRRGNRSPTEAERYSSHTQIE